MGDVEVEDRQDGNGGGDVDKEEEEVKSSAKPGEGGSAEKE